jgi:SanA protein
VRRRLRLALLVLAIPVAVVAAANAYVLLDARGGTRDSIAALPQAQTALVLGAQVRPDGTPSAMLEDRIATAEALYRAGKVEKLLLSGDHGRASYDEVGTMRRALLERGIPADDIFTDHAGFDTWDSAQRARRVFGVESAIVVTQRFHMARALFAAHRAGLDASGYAADRRDYGGVLARLRLREALARVKVVADAVAGSDPRFLGPQLPIEGDGRATWGPDEGSGNLTIARRATRLP